MNSTPLPETAPLDPADPVLRQLSDAVELARSAAEEVAGEEEVGAYVGAELEDAAAVTHLFDASTPGYRGWRWAVTVASAGLHHDVTVSEVVLLPGPDALVAPEWVPWQERVQAGDLGVGDLMPTAPDDPRLVPGYIESDDDAIESAARDVGLGRIRVMSRSARLDAAARWKGGEFGPRSDMARGAPGPCATCGFYLPLAGSLSAAFGVCGNEIAPADGHLVHAEYGCGAHSEAEVEQVSPVLVADLIYDDNAMLDIELIDLPVASEPAELSEQSITELVAVAQPEVAEPQVVEPVPDLAVDAVVAEPVVALPEVAESPADEVDTVPPVAVEAPAVELEVAEAPAVELDVTEPAAVESLIAQPEMAGESELGEPVVLVPDVPEPAVAESPVGEVDTVEAEAPVVEREVAEPVEAVVAQPEQEVVAAGLGGVRVRIVGLAQGGAEGAE
jgi:DUF3027 family protein